MPAHFVAAYRLPEETGGVVREKTDGGHVFLDPSLALRKGSLERIEQAARSSSTKIYTSSILKPGSNVYRQREWETFCRSFGVKKIPDPPDVASDLETLQFTFFGLEDSAVRQQQFVKEESLRELAGQGSFAQVEAEEIAFLLTHSVIAARTKEREHQLYRRWKEVRTAGRKVIHITVVGFDGSIQQLPIDVARAIPWLIWTVSGATLLASLGGLLAPAAAAALGAGGLANHGIALMSYQWTHPD